MGMAVAFGLAIAVSAMVIAYVGLNNFFQETTAPVSPTHATVAVTQDVLLEAVYGNVSLAPAWSRSLVEQSADKLVTRPGRTAGETVDQGTVLTVINERPVILLQGDTVLYRDLERGNSGEDVKALQKALNQLGFGVVADGKFGALTQRAVFKLYQRNGFVPLSAAGAPTTQISQTIVPRAEVSMVTSVPVRIVNSCGTIGERPGADFCLAEATRLSAEIEFSAEDRELVASGDKATLSWDSQEVTGTLGEQIHDSPLTPGATDAQDQGTSSRAGAIRFRFIGNVPDGVNSNAGGEAEIRKYESPQDSLIVAQIAISQVGDRSTVETSNGTTIPVQIVRCVTGKCVVTGELVAGDSLKIPSLADSTNG